MQQRSEETRANILDAAVRQFALSGYEAASVDQICSDAGVSKGAFYHHFPSKQALFLALLEGWLKTVEKGLEGMRQPTVPETFVQMTGLLPAVFAAADSQLPVMLEFWLQASRDEKVWESAIAPYRHYHQIFTRLVEDGVREGSLEAVDPRAAARVLVSMVIGLIFQGVFDPQGADWPEVAETSMKMLMNGMAKKPA
jgi:AcrR family transcriptional regulator